MASKHIARQQLRWPDVHATQLLHCSVVPMITDFISAARLNSSLNELRVCITWLGRPPARLHAQRTYNEYVQKFSTTSKRCTAHCSALQAVCCASPACWHTPCCSCTCCTMQLFATAGTDMVVGVYDDQQRTPLLRLSGGDGKDCCGHSNTVFGMAWKPEDCQVRPAACKLLAWMMVCLLLCACNRQCLAWPGSLRTACRQVRRQGGIACMADRALAALCMQ
jgi:hypothetical protein